MSDIKVGDIVRLRSGGPDMQVIEPVANGVFSCAYWSYKDECHSWASFGAQTLEPVKPAKEEPPEKVKNALFLLTVPMEMDNICEWWKAYRIVSNYMGIKP